MPVSPLDNLQPGAGVDNSPNPDLAAAANGPQMTPMTTPQPAQGNREEALINIHMAMDLMETALGKLGAESPEGQIVMKSVGALTKVFGGQRQNTEQLGNTQILQMLNQLPQAGGGTPEQKAAQQQPAVPGMAGLPPTGAPQGAAPPMPPPPMGGGMGAPPPGGI